ncbi:MAG: HD domain-containing phosphohydrolase [Anaerolineales bacterium]|nr:HD domain-containing phosphohydrolase [Anaerolineales bacterium]
MRTHPEHSRRIVKPVKSLAHILPWIYSHHEKWDGSGYPLGLKGQAIPLGARIIAISDAYDAMTTDRPYRHALTRETALKEIERCAGTQFDPELTALFLEIMAA